MTSQSKEWGEGWWFPTGGGVPSERVRDPVNRLRASEYTVLRGAHWVGTPLSQYPPQISDARLGGPPTCKLSAHGCGGGGGGSSGLRKTCWPRLRNWTTAMRMWCSTRTMLAATLPPARPCLRLPRSVSASANASLGPIECVQPRLGPAPGPPRPRLSSRCPGPRCMHGRDPGTPTPPHHRLSLHSCAPLQSPPSPGVRPAFRSPPGLLSSFLGSLLSLLGRRWSFGVPDQGPSISRGPPTTCQACACTQRPVLSGGGGTGRQSGRKGCEGSWVCSSSRK